MKSAFFGLTIILLLDFFQGGASAQTAATFAADATGQISFVTPSGNIGCTFTPQGGTGVYKPFDGDPVLSCDRRSRNMCAWWLRPNRFDASTMSATRIGLPEDNILPYGSRWSRGPF